MTAGSQPLPFDERMVLEGDFIWVINADAIPPHIGLSSGGSYYSLKYNGKDNGVSAKRLIDFFNSKGTRVLLFRLTDLNTIRMKTSFDRFVSTSAGNVTCLQPIKEALNIEANTIHELLSDLQSRDGVDSVYGLNLPEDFKGIPAYDLDDINRHLLKLEHVQG